MSTPGSQKYEFDVSIIIVSFNTREILRECLLSVRKETKALQAQIIVVDNSSTDGSVDMVRQDFPEVLLIPSKVNLGFGPANNLGFEAANGRYVILLNSDAFFTPGALELSIQHMDATPDCGLGGGRLVGRDGAWQPSARMFPTVMNDLLVLSGLAARFPKSRFFGRADRTWADEMDAAAVDWVPGAYSIIRAEALSEIGFFDPRFFLYYEEVDFCKRFKQKGYSIWYWPDIEVIHIGGESSRQVKSLELSKTGAQLTLWRMRSMLLYYRKHHGISARMAMMLEILWYWLRSQRRKLSSDPYRRQSAKTDQRLVRIMTQAWRETKGGRLSPAQPW